MSLLDGRLDEGLAGAEGATRAGADYPWPDPDSEIRAGPPRPPRAG